MSQPDTNEPQPADVDASPDSSETASALAARLGDQVVTPEGPGWADAVRAWNTTVQQSPLAVVTPRTVDDLREVLRIAADDGSRVALQRTGHGASSDLRGTVLVRPTAFDTIEIDADARTARLGAGVLWGQVARALRGTGLVAAFGSSPTTSVAGYLLAGGLSLFSRAHGLSARSLRAVEILTADGELRRVDDADGDLIWALRGAGGSLGAVTAVEIDLHPVDEIYGGQLLFAPDDAGRVLDILLTESAEAGDDFSAMITLAAFPEDDAVAPLLQGQRLLSLDAFGFDRNAEHTRAMDRIRLARQPLIDGGFGRLDLSQVHRVVNELASPTPTSDWSRLGTVGTTTADELVELFLAPEGEDLVTVQVRVLGGALTAGDPHPGIAGAIDDPHLVIARGFAGSELTDAAFSRLGRTITPGGDVRTVATFLGAGQTYADAYAPTSIDRLERVKAEVDPGELFQGNRAIR